MNLKRSEKTVLTHDRKNIYAYPPKYEIHYIMCRNWLIQLTWKNQKDDYCLPLHKTYPGNQLHRELNESRRLRQTGVI